MSFHSTTLLSRDRSDQDNITTVYSISMPNDKFLDPEFEILRQYSIRFSEQIPVSNSITFGSAIVLHHQIIPKKKMDSLVFANLVSWTKEWLKSLG